MSVSDVLLKFPNRETFENTNAILARIAGALENGGGKVYETNFAEVNKNVNLGLGPILYPVGTEFVAYKAHTAVASVGGQNTGVTSVSINAETFLSAIDTVDRKVKVFEYNGAWYYNGEAVNPSTYGLTLTGTPATGDTILVNMTCTKIIWVVRAHNHHATVSGAKYTMTIEMKWLYGTDTTYKTVVFDAPEAFYAHESDTALAIGTYNFNLPTTYDKWVAGNYQFTTAKTHPKGAQFCLSGYASTALTSLKVRIYDGGFNDIVVSEELTITAGSDGTSLGAMGTELNHCQRVSYGSNNNAQSNCRQFLNSTSPQGSVCKQMTKYDRKPSWETGSDNAYAGFLHGMGKDFLNAIATAVVPCRTNNVFETNSLDGTAFATGQTYNLHDKVFLLSRPEIWGDWDSASVKDGTLLEFYDGLTNLERIKYDEFGVAHYAWVRSPSPGSANLERYVGGTTGAVGYNGADGANGVAAACVIGGNQ